MIATSDVIKVFQFYLVWPLGFLTGYLGRNLNNYTPAQVTELQEVPLILQGSTDWGGSSVYAFYVYQHFALGILACLFGTAYVAFEGSRNTIKRILLGFLFAFLMVHLASIVEFLYFTFRNFSHIGSGDTKSDYFVCDYIQLILLFSIVFALSYFWIHFLNKTKISIFFKFLFCPIVILVFGLIASSGITPKAGKIMQGYQIPDYSSNSVRHAGLLKIHKLCVFCTGAYDKVRDNKTN